MAGEWTTLPLEDCMAAIIDYRGKTPEKTSFGVPLVTAKVIKGGRIETPDEFIAEADYEAWMRRGIPQRGDIVMTTEAPLGEVAQLNGTKIALAQRVITLRGKSDLIDNTFLKFLMQSSAFQEGLKARATGTTVLGIRQSELRKVDLTFPPFHTQRAIAHVLGTLDDLIELNRETNEILEEMARALFKSWFVDFDPVRAKLEGRPPAGMDAETAKLFPDHFEDSELGQIPRGWEVVTVSDLCEINGWTLRKGDQLPRLEYVEISAVKRGEIGEMPVYRRGEEPSRARRRLRHGDTVMSTVRPDRGAYFLALNPPTDRVASTGFAVLSPSCAPWSFLHAALTQPEVFDRLGHLADGGAYPAIRSEIIGAIQTAKPDNEAVLRAFHDVCAPIFEMVDAHRRESRELATLRDTLLPKLLSGEVSVPEAEKLVASPT